MNKPSTETITPPPPVTIPRSALPWSVGEHPGGNWGTDWRELLAPTPFGPAFVGVALLADAEFIVTAVNHHAALVAACERALSALYNVPLVGEEYDQQHSDTHLAASQELQEAIAKAKGQP